MSWVVRSVLAALSTALVLVVACGGGGSDSATGAAASSGSASSSGTGGGAATYGTSPCGTCVEQQACLSQLNACAADASCAAYLDCLDACPLGPNGDADTACEQTCPPVSGSAGQAAKDAFIDCRLSGPGAMCAGCGQIPAPTDPDFHQMCPASMDPNQCYKCEDEHCCDTYQACKNNPDCDALATCVKACPKLTYLPCSADCYSAHPAGYADWGHRFACLFHFCFDIDACGNEPLDPCVKCQNLHCADEMAACWHDLQCQLLEDCQVPCNADPACFMACDANFPTAVAIHNALIDCGLVYCDIACGGTN